MDEKFCSKCETTKPVSDFYTNRSRGDGLSQWCRDCQLAAGAQSARAIRLDLLAVLGGKCAECDWTDPRALQVDHVNGGGGAERRSRTVSGASRGFTEQVLARPGEFQLLCANHNWIKRVERNETRGPSTYRRNRPTKKLVGIGTGNAPAQTAALRRFTSDPEHQRRAAKASWVNVTPERREARRKAIAAKARGRRLVTSPDGSRHWSHPGDADVPQAEGTD